METLLNALIPLTFLGFHVAEVLFPARPLPKVKRWRLKGILFWMLSGAIVTNLPLLWQDFARAHRVLDLESLGMAGAALGLVVGNLLGYAYHRARHGVGMLWRFHQLHHSAERLDISGAFYFHPVESAGVAVLFSFVGSFLLGLSAEAAALSSAIGFFLACFQHANIRTPRWLGWVVQRPESHSVHHGRGVHAYNYGDLPFIDMIFGTFRNPAAREAEQGFWDGASAEVVPMLLAQDVTRAPRPGRDAPLAFDSP